MKCGDFAFRLVFVTLAIVLMGGIGGCGKAGGKKLSAVQGTVTYKGQPLDKGTVSFMPVPKGTTSSGEISNGKYRLSTYQKDDGVAAGSYKVAVIAWEQEPDMKTGGKPAIPKKYFDAEKSGLTAKVSEGPQQIDFELND